MFNKDNTPISPEKRANDLLAAGVRIYTRTELYADEQYDDNGQFIVNYSEEKTRDLQKLLAEIASKKPIIAIDLGNTLIAKDNSSLHIVEGALELIQNLKKLDVCLVLWTDDIRKNMQYFLDMVDFPSDLFDLVICAENYAYQRDGYRFLNVKVLKDIQGTILIDDLPMHKQANREKILYDGEGHRHIPNPNYERSEWCILVPGKELDENDKEIPIAPLDVTTIMGLVVWYLEQKKSISTRE